MDDLKDSDFSIDISDSTPNRAWSIGMGGSMLSSPLAGDGMIFFGCNDTFIYALNYDGEKEWSYKTGDMVWSTPTAYNDYVLAGSGDGHVYAFSKSGDLMWKFSAGKKVWATPCIAEGIVYIGSNDGILHALSLEDGKEMWKFQAANREFFHSPCAFNDSLTFTNLGGFLYRISAEGKLIWKRYIGEYASQNPLVIDRNNDEICSRRKRSFDKIPKASGCRIFVSSWDAHLKCIDAEDSSLIWKLFVNKCGASSPAIFEDSIFCGSYDGKVYSIDLKGRIKWKFQTGNKIVSSAFAHEGTVYIGSSDHNMYALDCKNGELVWRFLADNEILSSPCINNGILYFGSWDCHFYALSVKDRELLWKFRTSMGVPSYIKKPEMVKAGETPMKAPQPSGTTTIKGYQLERSNYSLQTGELTNTFYGLPAAYKGRKTAYEGVSGPYRR
ncbi:MAG: PQQ-like beta-propeller repeat protein [Candidatus Aenigmarchaeota archaeon]|nr:PQQ-like beta-propeller repeat protein [Candidatus Aenigmarchaeota archaeon]